MTLKLIFTLLTTLIVYSCTTTSHENFKVEYKGALKDIMLKGDISAKTDLSDFKDTDHLYALGALENLKGEILILDSRPLISSVKGNRLEVNNSFDHKATLLVYASVRKWNSTEMPDTVRTYEELELYLTQAAGNKGINTEKPFPFLIEGTVESLKWHVIDWKEGDAEHTHEKHRNSGLNGTLIRESVEILGFYSGLHHGIFTHHTTNMHLHMKTSDNSISGHVENLVLGREMILRLSDVK